MTPESFYLNYNLTRAREEGYEVEAESNPLPRAVSRANLYQLLDGTWKFTPLGVPGQRACKVTLELQYGFKSAALAAVVGPVFDKIAGNLVDAFVKRAEQVYG